MAFCSKFMSGIRKVSSQIDGPLGDIITEITRYTKLIKDSGLIPAGSKVEGWLNTAIDEIDPALKAVGGLQDKVDEWLNENDNTELERDAKIFKAAAVAAKVADVEVLGNEPKSMIVYETGTIGRIVADKYAA